MTKIIFQDGSVVLFVSNRFVFGANYSPAVLHLALYKKLRWRTFLYDKSVKERPQLSSSDPFNTAFIDDCLSASTDRYKSIMEKRRAQQILARHKFSFKETSDHEGVTSVEFAGKVYNGSDYSSSYLDKNMTKALGLCILLSCTEPS